MADKHGLSTPLDRNGLSGGDGSNIKLGRCQRQHVGGGAHGGDELDNEDASGGGVGEANSGEEEVGEGTTFWFGDAVDAVVFESVVDGAQFVELGSLEGGEGGGIVVGGGGDCW